MLSNKKSGLLLGLATMLGIGGLLTQGRPKPVVQKHHHQRVSSISAKERVARNKRNKQANISRKQNRGN
jgi:hypothetical protein